MSDYIRREDAIKKIETYWKECRTDNRGVEHTATVGEHTAVDMCKIAIQSMPSAEVVERKRGEWEGNCDNLRCSECGKDVMDYFHFTEDGCLSDYPNFCPNCGAQMTERSG